MSSESLSTVVDVVWAAFTYVVISTPRPLLHLVVTSGGVLSVMNSYGQSYGPPTSPANSRGFPPANSPGALDMYNSSQDSVGYVQAASPQPSGFASIVSITT